MLPSSFTYLAKGALASGSAEYTGSFSAGTLPRINSITTMVPRGTKNTTIWAVGDYGTCTRPLAGRPRPRPADAAPRRVQASP